MNEKLRFALIVSIAECLERFLEARARRKHRRFWEKELAHAARAYDSSRVQIAAEQLKAM